MSCPYFYPVEARSGSPMLPLGELWAGECTAAPGAPYPPGQDCCNMGYARGHCHNFPDGDGPDAARFMISSHENSTIGILYVLERDHLPFAHGTLEYSCAAGGFLEAPPSGTLARQAQAYAESFLRRKKESGWKENR
jgi:hypothetical protein